MKLRYSLLLLAASVFILGACNSSRFFGGRKDKEQEIKTSSQSADSHSQSSRIRVDTILFTDTVYEKEIVTVTPRQFTEVYLEDLCDSLGRVKGDIKVKTNNAEISSDGNGLSIKCDCEEKVDSIRESLGKRIIERNSFESKLDSASTAYSDLKLQIEKRQVVKTPVWFWFAVAGMIFLLLFLAYRWIRSRIV